VAEHLPRTGLVAEYLFDGNSADTSGNSRHGVVHGATLTADRLGRAAHAYAFDGVDDYIEVTPPPAFGDQLSVSVWVRYDSSDFGYWTNTIVAQDDGNDDDQARRVFQLSTWCGHIVWHRMMGARDPMCRRRVRPGQWQHVVGVHDRGVNRLYVDGSLHDTVTHQLWTHPSQPLHIGRKGTDERYFFFRGAIDDVRIYDRALEAVDLRALLQEGGWNAPRSTSFAGNTDPLTGRWGQHGVVFLDLQYDGREVVTGRIMAGRPHNMATIASGRFDRTSGELRLSGDARHHQTREPVQWTIEGLLDGGEVAVTATFNDYNGNYLLSRRGARPRLSRRSMRSQLGALAFRLRRRLRL